jgi:tetratricopeptide (TPR) repeat protein
MKNLMLIIGISLGLLSMVRAEDHALLEELKKAYPGQIAKIQALNDKGSQPANVLHQVMKASNPEFKKAVAALEAGDLPAAIKGFQKVKAEAKEELLVAENGYMLGKALMADEDYENALPEFDALTRNTNAVRAGEDLFFLGRVQAELRDVEGAKDSLIAFLNGHPDASKRMISEAEDLMHALDELPPSGSIAHIGQEMNHSRRMLKHAKTGDVTQQKQKQIIDLLEALIEQAEQSEQQQQQQQQQAQKPGPPKPGQPKPGEGQAQGKKPGQKPGMKPGEQGNANEQGAGKRVRKLAGRDGEDWAYSKQTQRMGEAIAGLKTRFPSRYQQLVEQYYLDLQGEIDAGDEE